MPSVIIVPGQGHNVPHFRRVAESLKRDVYGSRATILTTTLNYSGPPPHVSFSRDSRRDWASFYFTGLSSVLIISHGGSDGPNLAYLANDRVDPELHQPWGQVQGRAGLTSEAEAFWLGVKDTLAGDAKVILLGCLMGTYAQQVTLKVNKPVYAANRTFHAAEYSNWVRPHVLAIENPPLALLDGMTCTGTCPVRQPLRRGP